MMTNDFDYSAQISFMDIRENLPAIDPENVSAQQVVEVLLYLMRQKVDFGTVAMRSIIRKQPGSMGFFSG